MSGRTIPYGALALPSSSLAYENSVALTYQPALDGLRAVAVCMVAAYHVDKSYLPGGWIGVDVFFVLSGYLITSILLGELQAQGSLSFRNFYIRRVLRLVPAFWCLLAFVTITAPLRSHPKLTLEAVAASGAYVMNWTRAFQICPQDILGHTWSLAIEEQYYLLWPLLLLSIYRRRPALWLGTMIVALLTWRCILVFRGTSPVRIYTGFDTHCDGLLLGSLLALLPPSASFAKRAAQTCALPCVVLALLAASCEMQSRSAQTLGYLLVAALTTWLIVAARSRGPLQLCLSVPPIVYTGRISYGLYLWHYPMIALANDRFGLRGALVAVALSYLVAVISPSNSRKDVSRL